MRKTDCTLVFGASLNPSRYSNMLLKSLSDKGFRAIGFGLARGTAHNIQITSNLEDVQDIHTISMYMRADRQAEYLERLLALRPKRVIFNPGAENPEAYPQWEAAGVQVEESCNLVLLATGVY